MRSVLSITCHLLLASLSVAQQFPIDGTKITLHVDAETLDNTPRWKPGVGPLPVSAEQAIEIADRYHRSQELGGWAVHCSWTFSRAILETKKDGHGYWIITCKGVFGAASPKTSGGYFYTDGRESCARKDYRQRHAS